MSQTFGMKPDFKQSKYAGVKMNQYRKIILGVILIGVVATASIGIVIFLDTPPITDDSRIQQLMDEGDIPSFAAGIIINDTLVWSKGYGEQPSLDTVYMIGSVTKTFTATAIMQLNESGYLDLDADIHFLYLLKRI